LPCLLADPAAGSDRLWLTGGRLFDGTGAPVREASGVLVEDGRIAAVGHASDGVPDGVTVIELAGRMLLPGLIDAHAHVNADRPTPAPGAEPLSPGVDAHFLAAGLRETLRRGVTTLRDVGSYGDLVFHARQAMRYGAFRGPRLLSCGQIVSATAPGSRFFEGMYREADGPDDVRRAVREQLRRGADFIKVMTTGARSVELEDPEPAQLTRAEVAALVEEAHRQGYRVAAHAEGIAGTEIAIEEGIDTIEHGMYLNQRPDLLERMAARGQVLVSTLSCFYGVSGLEDLVGADGQAAHEEPGEPPAPTWSPLLVELARYNLAQADLTLKAARAAGVRIAAGHDWSPVWNVAIEIRRMIAHGLSANEALVAGTTGSAYALGLDAHVGSVAVGQRADLLVLDGDPLERPESLGERENVWLVIQHGAPVAGAALERDLLIPSAQDRTPRAPAAPGPRAPVEQADRPSPARA
jgi:imidazolonepropionase-like amidohydrolase